MKKNNKIYIFLIIIFIVFFFLMYYFVGKEEIEKEKREATILLGEETIWKINADQIFESKDNIEDYNWKKMPVYLNGKYQNDYYIWHDDTWYIFDDEKNPINYTDNFMAIESTFNLATQEIETTELEDKSIINNYLNQKGISISSELTIKEQTNIDIDSDNNKETIYVITNAMAFDFTPSKTFAYVFMIKDGVTYDIYSYENKSTANSKVPYVYGVLDIDNDGIYEIITAHTGYVTEKSNYNIYKFENNQFKSLISNN